MASSCNVREGLGLTIFDNSIFFLFLNSSSLNTNNIFEFAKLCWRQQSEIPFF